MKHRGISATVQRYHDQLTELDQVISFSVNGISREVVTPKAVKTLIKYEAVSGKPSSLEDQERRIEGANGRAAFARRQMEAGFPVLYAHATMAIWSALECLVEDLIVNELIAESKYLQRDELKRVRISLADYEVLEREERMRYLLNELARQTKADLKHGISRFEILLQLVDLAGPTTKEMKRVCYEIWAVRNLVAHRAGVIDRRFLELCPWIEAKPGEVYRVTEDSYVKYRGFAIDYSVELLLRDLVRDGMERKAAERSLRTECAP